MSVRYQDMANESRPNLVSRTLMISQYLVNIVVYLATVYYLLYMFTIFWYIRNGCIIACFAGFNLVFNLGIYFNAISLNFVSQLCWCFVIDACAASSYVWRRQNALGRSAGRTSTNAGALLCLYAECILLPLTRKMVTYWWACRLGEWVNECVMFNAWRVGVSATPPRFVMWQLYKNWPWLWYCV